MTCKALRLPALAVGAATLALSVVSPAWAWTYSRHHAAYWGYRTHHVVVHRPAYRYGAYRTTGYAFTTPAAVATAPFAAAGDVVGGAATATADIFGGAGALAGDIVGGVLGAPFGYTNPYGYSGYTYPYGYSGGLSNATALVGTYPSTYTYDYNCAYGYPSAAYPGEYCPPYGYYGANYYGSGYPYAYDYGYGYPDYALGYGFGYGAPFFGVGYGYGYPYASGYGYGRFHRFGYNRYGFRPGMRTWVRSGLTTASFGDAGAPRVRAARFGHRGFGGAHFARAGFGGAHVGGAHFGGMRGAQFAGGGAHFGAGGAHFH